MTEEQPTIYQYPPQFGIENSLHVACNSEGFDVSGHSNELQFEELENRIMKIVEKLVVKTKKEPKNYHG